MDGMPEERKKLLIVSTHAIQYMGPMYRRMSRDPRFDLLVAYCSLQGAEAGHDPEFGMQVKWDVPILHGYRWIHIPNRSPSPGLGKFFGLFNPGLWRTIRSGKFDAVLVYGYANVSYWIAILAARFSRAALILGTDATTLRPRDNRDWKVPLKRVLLPRIFGLADAVCGPSSAGVQFLGSLGIPPNRVFLTHYTIDNESYRAAAAESDTLATRRTWAIPGSAPIALFCGKLRDWKRPEYLLRAFAGAAVPESYLVYAGEGPMRSSLEREARDLGVTDQVRFLGFANQSELPHIYAASDLLVLPSQHEPWGLVVNEAMACGRPAIVTNRVGAREDLIVEGETGYSYPHEDVDQLARLLADLLGSPEKLREMGDAAGKRIDTWSYREHIDGLARAMDAGVRHKRGEPV